MRTDYIGGEIIEEVFKAEVGERSDSESNSSVEDGEIKLGSDPFEVFSCFLLESEFGKNIPRKRLRGSFTETLCSSSMSSSRISTRDPYFFASSCKSVAPLVSRAVV